MKTTKRLVSSAANVIILHFCWAALRATLGGVIQRLSRLYWAILGSQQLGAGGSEARIVRAKVSERAVYA